VKEVEWLGLNKCRWLVKTYAGGFIYVYVKGYPSAREPRLKRSLIFEGKRYYEKVLFSEEYDLNDAESVVKAELAILERLKRGDSDIEDPKTKLASIIRQLNELLLIMEEGWWRKHER